MAKKTQRIVEAYCWRPVLTRKNPTSGKKKMKVAGGCIIATSEKGRVKYFGAGTVKIIPVSRKDVKTIGTDLGLWREWKKRKRKR